MPQPMWQSEDHFRESVLPFHLLRQGLLFLLGYRDIQAYVSMLSRVSLVVYKPNLMVAKLGFK